MTDIRDYFERVKTTGEGFRANCPRCDDKEMKFYFNLEKGVGCCFHAECAWGTTAGGATEYRIKSFFGDRPPVVSYPSEVVEAEEADLKLPEGFELIADTGRNRSTLMSYLVGVRGLKEKVVKMAKLGYCDTGKMWGYFIFPVFNEDDEVVYWQGRRFKKRKSKFFNPISSQRSKILYDVPSGHHPKRIVLVESVLNALTLLNQENSGTTKIFALLGKTLTEPQINKILAYERDALDIVVALDPDAWRQAVEIAKELCTALPVRLAEFLPGEDVNSIGRAEAWSRINDAPLYSRRDHVTILQSGLRRAKAR